MPNATNFEATNADLLLLDPEWIPSPLSNASRARVARVITITTGLMHLVTCCGLGIASIVITAIPRLAQAGSIATSRLWG